MCSLWKYPPMLVQLTSTYNLRHHQNRFLSAVLFEHAMLRQTYTPADSRRQTYTRNHFICILSHVFTVPISSLAVSHPWYDIPPATCMWVFDIDVWYVGVLWILVIGFSWGGTGRCWGCGVWRLRILTWMRRWLRDRFDRELCSGELGFCHFRVFSIFWSLPFDV